MGFNAPAGPEAREKSRSAPPTCRPRYLPGAPPVASGGSGIWDWQPERGPGPVRYLARAPTRLEQPSRSDSELSHEGAKVDKGTCPDLLPYLLSQGSNSTDAVSYRTEYREYSVRLCHCSFGHTSMPSVRRNGMAPGFRSKISATSEGTLPARAIR